MLITRLLFTSQVFRVFALALPLAVAAYSQAMIQHGAAVALGTTAGAAAGKGTSDALSRVMNGAAATGKAAASSDSAADVAAAEARIMAPKRESAKPASMPPAPEAAPLPVAKGAKATKTDSKTDVRNAEQQLLASVAPTVSSVTGKPVARTKRGTHVAMVEKPAVEAAPVAEAEPELIQVIGEFHPELQPMVERLQRITPGSSRDDLKRILGLPSSKVTIPADRDVSEIYYYQDKGHNVGVIRLEAGSVTKITIDSM